MRPRPATGGSRCQTRKPVSGGSSSATKDTGATSSRENTLTTCPASGGFTVVGHGHDSENGWVVWPWPRLPLFLLQLAFSRAPDLGARCGLWPLVAVATRCRAMWRLASGGLRSKDTAQGSVWRLASGEGSWLMPCLWRRAGLWRRPEQTPDWASTNRGGVNPKSGKMQSDHGAGLWRLYSRGPRPR